MSDLSKAKWEWSFPDVQSVGHEDPEDDHHVAVVLEADYGRLIAAAPDLLAACIALFESGGPVGRLDGVRNAIEKATGMDLTTALKEYQ